MSGEHTAFFYGTLMVPEVFYSVCYGTKSPPEAVKSLHTFTPAVLNDHCRRRVKLADYPGVIAEAGHNVRGIYATGLTDANMVKLDHFEGSEYERVTVSVNPLKSLDGDETHGPSQKTGVYIFLHPDELEQKEWDVDEFRRDKMELWTRGDWAYNEGMGA
ncbi:hypothetical protein K4F52_000936 [Lecanicillium sp. MT-2017a]|nr:hypothetical protein K4F52_000936 [Lecanicillium sp. MT-2017a]